MGRAVKTRARENPFGSDRVEDLLSFEPEWLGQTWVGLMGKLRDLEYRAAVVGPHGSGKTTLLLGLKTRLEDQGNPVESFFLNDEQRTLSEADWRRFVAVAEDKSAVDGKIVFLDGAEQMSWRNWRRFQTTVSSYSGLVITQHRPGKLPLLVNTETSLEMFRKFVRRLAPDFDWSGSAVERMYLRSNGNIREALWQCYDLVANGGQSEFD